MKVGDLVVQKDKNPVISLKGFQKSGKKIVGIILKVREQPPEMWKYHPQWAKALGDTVDVLWSTGKLSENFASAGLEVVSEGGSPQMDFMNIVAFKEELGTIYTL